MSEFLRHFLAHDQRAGMPPTIRVPKDAEMRHLSTADLRLLLAQAFTVANAVCDRRRGRVRALSEIHITAAQDILRKAFQDALSALSDALREPAPGGDWSDHYDAPEEELTGPPKPLPPRV